MRLGWLLLLVLLVVSRWEPRAEREGADGALPAQVTSMPPLFGYGTCITLCGFAFGFWHGWLLAVAGCLLGGATSFLRVVFSPSTLRSS